MDDLRLRTTDREFELRYVQLDDSRSLGAEGARTTLVVPSHRLRDALLAGIADEARGRALAVELPHVVAVDELVMELHEWLVLAGEAPPRRVLTPTAFRLMIESSLDGERKRSGDLFESGWRLVHDYAMSNALARPSAARFGDDDTGRFADWLFALEARIARQDRITLPQLPAAAVLALSRARRSPLDRLTCIGFEHETPAFRALLDALAHKGCDVRRIALHGQMSSSPLLLRCEDEDDEIRRAVSWAHERIPALGDDDRIGIVVPDLGQRYDAVLRALGIAFGSVGSDAPFNISGGIPLGTVPIVDDALMLLRWCVRPERRECVDRLLASPFLDLEFLRDPGPGTRLPSAHSMPERAAAVANPRAADFVRQVRRWMQRASLDVRVNEFRALLRSAGWPGGATLRSEAHQAQQAFGALLDDLAAAADLLVPTQSAAAIESIASAASRQPFAPDRPRVPLQVLGHLESVGLRFSALWVSGLSRDAWPPAPRVHPLVPYRMQIEHGVPRLTTNEEVAFSRRMVNGWRGAAPEVRVSHPATREGDSTSMSPLFADGARSYSPISNTAPRRAEISPLESMDSTARPIDTTNGRAIGADAVRNQSLCPFRAFAIHRLNLEPCRAPSPFPRPDERGTTLHDLMRRLCIEIPAQAALSRLSREERARIVADAVEWALQVSSQRGAPPFYLANERIRLLELALDWLEVDLDRPPFVTESTELAVETRLGGVPIRLRIDRIDRDLATGGRVLIDYKSGASAPTLWRGARPEDPQLPLYAVAMREVEDLAFALVRRKASRLQGVSAAAARYRAVPSPRIRMTEPADFGEPSWEDLVSQWRATATTLVEGHAVGRAEVDPIRPSVCRECHLHTLCRIDDGIVPYDDV